VINKTRTDAIANARGGFAMPADKAGRAWLCAASEFYGHLSVQETGVRTVRIAATDRLVPVTGAPAWSPPT